MKTNAMDDSVRNELVEGKTHKPNQTKAKMKPTYFKQHLLPAALLAVLSPFAAQAGTIANGTLYYSTHAGGVNVHKVDYSYDGATSFSISNNTNIATTNGADGLLFAPNGNLIVAGQTSRQLHEITPSGTAVTTVNAGTGSYHLALSSNASNATLYNLWNDVGGGGSTSISATTLSGGGLSTNGTPYTVSCSVTTPGCSTDVRGLAFNPLTSKWYYGTAADGAAGQYGEVSFSGTTATLTRLSSGVYAHGLTWDSYLGAVIVSSATHVQQMNDAGAVVADLFVGKAVGSSTIGGGNYDQTAVDGLGHLFVASEINGNLLFFDYSGQTTIGGATFYASSFLANALDDIAPLSGIGSQTSDVPEPTSLALFSIGLAAAVSCRRKSV